MTEYLEFPELEPGDKAILEDGRCVVIDDRMADLVFVKLGDQRWETHVSEVMEIDVKDAVEPEEDWF